MGKDKNSFLQESKKVFWDIILLYRNFLHWNISKCLIGIAGILLGLLLSLPFLLILIIVAILDPISWLEILSYVGNGTSVSFEILSQMLQYPFYVIGEFFLFCLFVVFFILGSSYSLVLKTNLYFGYLKEKPVPYLGNHYFNIKLITQYIKIFFKILGYLILPFVIFLGITIVLYVLYKINIAGFYVFSYISFAFFIFALSTFLYLSYRLTFSYMVLLDRKDIHDKTTAKEIVQKSWKLTQGSVVVYFLFFVIIFVFVTAPFNAVEEYLDTRNADAKQYLGYKTEQISLQTEEAQFDYQMLSRKFNEQSDNEILEDIVLIGKVKVAYTILAFLIIEGVFQMLLISFYRHFLVHEKKRRSFLTSFKKALFKKK